MSWREQALHPSPSVSRTTAGRPRSASSASTRSAAVPAARAGGLGARVGPQGRAHGLRLRPVGGDLDQEHHPLVLMIEDVAMLDELPGEILDAHPDRHRLARPEGKRVAPDRPVGPAQLGVGGG